MEIALSKWFLLPYKKGSTIKGKNLLLLVRAIKKGDSGVMWKGLDQSVHPRSLISPSLPSNRE